MPFCTDTRRAVSAPRASSATANRSSTSPRRAGDQVAQPLGSSNAFLAAPTAASMSRSMAAGTLPRCSSVAASVTRIRSADAGAAHCPSM
jgi:hypothetical protein